MRVRYGMGKITKKAKRVNVTWEEYTYISHKSIYQCPSCYTNFHNTLQQRNITRFICDCGQELMVDEVINKKVNDECD